VDICGRREGADNRGHNIAAEVGRVWAEEILFGIDIQSGAGRRSSRFSNDRGNPGKNDLPNGGRPGKDDLRFII